MTKNMPAVESITVTLLQGNLLSDESPTRAAVERLAQSTADALAAAFPGAYITVPVKWRTSGAGPRPHVIGDSAGDAGVEERIAEVSGAAWEAWCRTLTDSDTERVK